MIRIWKSHLFLSRIRQSVLLLPVFQSNFGLDHPDPDSQFSRLPNPDYQCSKWDNISQCGQPAMQRTGRRANIGVTVSVSYFEPKHKWGQDNFYFIFTLLH